MSASVQLRTIDTYQPSVVQFNFTSDRIRHVHDIWRVMENDQKWVSFHKVWPTIYQHVSFEIPFENQSYLRCNYVVLERAYDFGSSYRDGIHVVLL